MTHFCDKLEIGQMVVFAEKSKSCDVIVKVAKKYVFEFQVKSGKQERFDSTAAKREIKNEVVGFRGYGP